ncbi:MAG: hypothetical protein E3J87_03365 [Candidatus Cloacimonadota bacterium]|nr:MAG: hypothetical protein E3J87_03365 [Candidatus Cloacimonadota bacterium]
MLLWIVVMCLLVLTSLVQHLGFFTFPFLMDPWDKIILDILLLIIILGILYRMVTKKKTGEKEKLRDKIKELVAEIKMLKGEEEEKNVL